MSISEVKKTIITGLGMVIAVGLFLTQQAGFLSSLPWGGTLLTVAGLVVGGATVLLNYLAPNETADPARAVGRSVRLKGEKPVPQ